MSAAKRIKLSSAPAEDHLLLKQAFCKIPDVEPPMPAEVRRAWDDVVRFKWLVDDLGRLRVNLKALGDVAAEPFLEHQAAIEEGLRDKLAAATTEHAEARRNFVKEAAAAASGQAQPALKVLRDSAFDIGRGLPKRVFPLGPDGALHLNGSFVRRWKAPEDGWLDFETVAMVLYMMPYTPQATLDKFMAGARAAGVQWLVNAPSLRPDVLKETHPHFAEKIKASVPPANMIDYGAYLAARRAFDELETFFDTVVFMQDDHPHLLNLANPEDVWHGIVCSYHGIRHTDISRELPEAAEGVIRDHRPDDVDCIRVKVDQHGLPSGAGDGVVVGGHRTVRLQVFFARGRYVATVSRTLKPTGFARPNLRDSFFGGCLRRCEITLEEAARGSTLYPDDDDGAPHHHLTLYVKEMNDDDVPAAAAAAAAAGL